MIKYKNKKTRCTKIYRFTAKEIADIAGISESYVKKIRLNPSIHTSSQAQQIIAIDETLQDGSDKLINEIKRIVQL